MKLLIFIIGLNLFLHWLFWVLTSDFLFDNGDDGLLAKTSYLFMVLVNNVLAFSFIIFNKMGVLLIDRIYIIYLLFTSLVFLVHYMMNVASDEDWFSHSSKFFNFIINASLSVGVVVLWYVMFF